jgi:hypothetical protein
VVCSQLVRLSLSAKVLKNAGTPSTRTSQLWVMPNMRPLDVALPGLADL